MSDPIRIQRIEGAALLVAAVAGFEVAGWSWWWFAALLLAVDISMVGYLAGPKVGAATYNLGHALIGPAALLTWWLLDGSAAVLALGSIWLAHIGMDRAFGYGLKHADRFEHTHLGMIGRNRLQPPASSLQQEPDPGS
jgi:hypothetical protein